MPWPQIRFLDEEGAIIKSRNKLPHWQQESRTYFITFRLADSIPQSVMKQWREERQQWIGCHPQPWDEITELEYHRLFSHTIDRRLDECLGSCVLRDEAAGALMAGVLCFFDDQRHYHHAWVVMPNHVHILTSLAENQALPDLVRSWKSFSSRKIRLHEGKAGALWQKDYFDRLIRDWDHFINVARYIRNNPRKTRLPTGAFKLFVAPWVQQLLS